MFGNFGIVFTAVHDGGVIAPPQVGQFAGGRRWFLRASGTSPPGAATRFRVRAAFREALRINVIIGADALQYFRWSGSRWPAALAIDMFERLRGEADC